MIPPAKGARIEESRPGMMVLCREDRSLVALPQVVSCGGVETVITSTLSCPVPKAAPNCWLVSMLMTCRMVCRGDFSFGRRLTLSRRTRIPRLGRPQMATTRGEEALQEVTNTQGSAGAESSRGLALVNCRDSWRGINVSRL